MKNEQEKSSNRLYYYIAVAIVVLSACYFLFGSGAGLHDYSDRIDELGSRVEQSVQSNRELQDGIGNATETVDRLADVLNRSETTVDAAKGTAESLDSNLETAADAITKCKRIVDRIKQRNEERTPEP